MTRSAPILAATIMVAAFAVPAAAAAETSDLRDFCAERPGATTPPCILDVGHVMAEVDLLDITRARQEGGGWTQTTVALSPHLRLGLTSTIEAGITLQPYLQQRLGAGIVPGSVTSGVADATVDLKVSLRHPDGGGLSIALLPYVSVPLAQRGLGAGGFQGGLIAPISMPLPGGFSLGLAPEADVLRSAGGGVHGALLGAVSLAHPLTLGLTGAVELISSVGEGGDQHLHQTSAGANLAWIPPKLPNLQLDLGADAGLSHDAPAVRAYVGVSRRF